MPIYDFTCGVCNRKFEAYVVNSETPSVCCGKPAEKQFSGTFKIKTGYPKWIDKIDEIHKRESQNGERLRFVHPQEVL
jgi:putative FmdB family regulatory protein